MSSGAPSRDLLSKVFSDHQQLRAFERLFETANVTLPGQVDGLATGLADVGTELNALHLITNGLGGELAAAKAEGERRAQASEYAASLASASAAELSALGARLAAIEAYLGI